MSAAVRNHDRAASSVVATSFRKSCSSTHAEASDAAASASLPASSGPTTSLWGIWEMWCDFPMRSSQGSGALRTVSGSMADKLQQAQSPTWLDTIRSLGLIDTAEGFWGIHDCTLPPSRLPNGSNYYLFRNNVAPMWEQEANRRGGKWVAQFSIDQSVDVDRAWLEVCLAAIGEQMPCAEEEICGVCVAKRRSGYKVAVWTRTAADEATQVSIGQFVKNLVHPQSDGSTSLKYLPHCEILQTCAARGTSTGSTHSAPLSPTSLTNTTESAAARVPEPLYVA